MKWQRRFLVVLTATLCTSAVAADPSRGETLYVSRCGACHSIDDNGAGPKHRGLFGRKSGTQEGFDYSEALKGAKLTWDEATVARWLENPNALVPGNKMVVQLANQPQDREDLIAYLKKATAIPPAPGKPSKR